MASAFFASAASSPSTAAGIQSGGSLLGGYFSAKAAKKEARKARSWQRNVILKESGWKMRGLRDAGLNPILAAGTPFAGGGGAPGAAPVPDYSKVGENVARGISSALDIKRTKQEIENLKQIKLNIRQDTQLKRVQQWDTNSAAGLKDANKRLLNLQVPGASAESEIDSSAFGRFMRYVDRLNPITKSPLSRPTGRK